MLVTYIYHSCYMVELEHHILLFDYFKGELPALDATKKLYVFASHVHHDHYSNKVYQIQHPDITYILSDDIHETTHKVMFMAPHETCEVDDLHITTLASTDQGVAFLITAEHKTIFHAGDLNWWDWGNEDSEQESIAMEKAYKKELSLLKGIVMDVAFLVLDPRLQERYAKGMDEFMKSCNALVVFPMHMWRDVEIIKRLYAREDISYQRSVQQITCEGQVFHI